MQIVKMSERQNMRITGEKNTEEITRDFREQMLLNNSIEGLLKFEIIEIDGTKTYEYKVENMESLEMKCEKEKLKGEKISIILNRILEILRRGSEYMLKESDFCIEPDSIYLDKNDNVQLAYFPNYNKGILEQLNHLSDFLMNRVDYNDDSAVVLIYAFYMKTKESNCTIEGLVKLIKEKSTPSEQAEKITDSRRISDRAHIMPYDNRPSDSFLKVGDELHYDYEMKNSEEIFDEKTQNHIDINTEGSTIKINEIFRYATFKQKLMLALGIVIPVFIFALIWFSGLCRDNRGQIDIVKLAAIAVVESVIVIILERKIIDSLTEIKTRHSLKSMREEDEATVMLSMDSAKRENPCLVTLCSLVSDDSPVINVTKFPFFIGADEEHMDFALKRTGVSRRHLRLDKTNGVITLSDLNSTNGTILNGKELLPQTPYSLKRGDKIVLGSCSYYLN